LAAALDATLDEPRDAVRLEVTGLSPALGTYLTITRRTATGAPVGVRGAVMHSFTGTTSYVTRDYEAPLDVPLTYELTTYNAGGVVVSTGVVDTITVEFGDCDAWLVDLARPTNSLEVEIESMRELDFGIPVGVHRVLDRPAPVLTSLAAWTPSTELITLTETLGERDQTRRLLGSGYPFLLRTSPELGIGNVYFGPTEFIEERFLTLGRAPQRRFRIACVVVDRPDPSIYVPIAPNTYANVKASYATYQALKDTGLSYDEVAYAIP
jgi:hypothetical protein